MIAYEIQIQSNSIQCKFTYFSDDFYFFCNTKDNEKILCIFDDVLEKYELERSGKKEIWDYEAFNNRNVVARYWKKLIAHCNIRYKEESDVNRLYFINQIVYRMSKLEDKKLKRIFINNIFKTKYFRELQLEKFQIKKYDYHQLCFILKYSPEVMLYMADKFSEMKDFDNNKLYEFFSVRYKESLTGKFNDEQLYYFYAISLFGFDEILLEYKDLVSRSKNQILISYYLKDGLFDPQQISYLKTLIDEGYWFQSYHLILYTPELLSDIDDSIETYLIPKKILLDLSLKPTKESLIEKRETYLQFYRDNLQGNRKIIRNISEVKEEIINYLELKIAESEEFFKAEED